VNIDNNRKAGVIKMEKPTHYIDHTISGVSKSDEDFEEFEKMLEEAKAEKTRKDAATSDPLEPTQ
jgi:hypothetical protein